MECAWRKRRKKVATSASASIFSIHQHQHQQPTPSPALHLMLSPWLSSMTSTANTDTTITNTAFDVECLAELHD
eukprot:7690976-Lingulodinium_polyedra.AAC.1